MIIRVKNSRSLYYKKTFYFQIKNKQVYFSLNDDDVGKTYVQNIGDNIFIFPSESDSALTRKEQKVVIMNIFEDKFLRSKI